MFNEEYSECPVHCRVQGRGHRRVKLTFNDDYLEDENGPYSKGMIVETNDNIHEGFMAKRWEQGFIPVVIDDETEWFLKSSFKDFEDD